MPGLVDTHSHLYLEAFAADIAETITRAKDAGLVNILLPNIDETSWAPMQHLANQYPGYCRMMAGLHPTSVLPDTVKEQLDRVTAELLSGKYCAVGEIGIDLYWDRTYLTLQEETFRYQLRLAQEHQLPVAIHVRNSYNEVWRILKQEAGNGLKGVFHCFPGNALQARQVTEAGFLLGIGGVVTYKKSDMQEVVKAIGPDHLVLETDSPFLPPVPYRGQRNEPAYVTVIAARVAELCGLPVAEVAEITTHNARRLFSI